MSEHDLTVTLTASVSDELIKRAGVEQDERGRWQVPEEASGLVSNFDWTWAKDEALQWALVIIASVDEPECLVWP